MSDDIDHIESQNKGLQVQTSNQRALLAELDQLLVCLLPLIKDESSYRDRIQSISLNRIFLRSSKRTWTVRTV